MQFVDNRLQVIIFALLLIFFCLCFSVLVSWMRVAVVKYKISENDMSADIEQSSRGDRELGLPGDGATDAVRGEKVGAKRLAEAEDIGLNLRCTLPKYCQESGGMMDVGRFSAITAGSKNLAVGDQNNFQRDTVLGAWKQRWAVLRERCAGIIVNARLAGMPLVQWEKGVS